MKLLTSAIDKISLIYLTLPLIIFLTCWLNPYAAIISLAALAGCLFFVFRQLKSDEFNVSKTVICITSAVIILWCLMSGIGNLFYQSNDWHMRNAIFRDLINFSFPVVYDNGSALVYYFGQMLPAAVIGKLLMFFGASEHAAFRIGNYFNLCYASLGVFLVFMQMLIYTKSKNIQPYIVLLIFIFYSGLDILYASFPVTYLNIEAHSLLQYSSNTTLLFWVYNQTIAPWLITMLFLRNTEKISDFAFLGVLGMFFAPLPFIGLFIYLAGMTGIKFVKSFYDKQLLQFFKELFSVQNLLSIIFIFPIIFLYYKSNHTAAEEHLRLFPCYDTIFQLIAMEALIFLLIIFERNYKKPLFYLTGVSLIIFPFFKIGSNPDFCMRASIPALLILMVFIIKFLFDNKATMAFKKLLILCLLIGAVTPVFEFYRAIRYTYFDYAEAPIKDNFITLNNKTDDWCELRWFYMGNNMFGVLNYCNYASTAPAKEVFFKYLAK